MQMQTCLWHEAGVGLCHAQLVLQQHVHHCRQDSVSDMCGRHQMQANADNKHFLACRMIIQLLTGPEIAPVLLGL